jgi:hypothetical protein
LVDSINVGITEETGADAPETPEVVTDRPEWLPEKFKAPEDMAKAYGELEKQFTKERQGDTKASTEDTGDVVDSTDAKEAVDSTGLDFDTLSTSYAENGSLSEAEYGSLEAKGIDRGMVDQYIAGQKSIAAGVQSEIHNEVGGSEAYTEMVGWAGENMESTEVTAYNNAVNSGERSQVNLAVQGLKARYESANGRQPSNIGGRTSQTSGDAYNSWAQVTADMNNPQYKTDTAFRETVQNKLGRSNPK